MHIAIARISIPISTTLALSTVRNLLKAYRRAGGLVAADREVDQHVVNASLLGLRLRCCLAVLCCLIDRAAPRRAFERPHGQTLTNIQAGSLSIGLLEGVLQLLHDFSAGSVLGKLRVQVDSQVSDCSLPCSQKIEKSCQS